MPRPSPESDELVDALMRAARSLRHGWLTALEPLGLPPHQARALHVISRGDGLRLSELAAGLRIAPRSATEVVDGLADRGLAERHPDPDDRRAVVVRLTDPGREALERAQVARREAAAELLGRLDGEERAQLAALLRRLVD